MSASRVSGHSLSAYKYSNSDSATHTTMVNTISAYRWCSGSDRPIPAMNESSWLTTTSTAMPIRISGRTSKILLSTEKVVASMAFRRWGRQGAAAGVGTAWAGSWVRKTGRSAGGECPTGLH